VRIVLDTSGYSHFRGNHEEVVALIAGADIVLLPTIVLGELDAGFRLGRREADNRAVLDAFLGEDFVEVLPITRAVSGRYGQTFAELRRAGTPIPVNDIWIAAAAIESAGTLVTFDRDFERVGELDAVVLA
jgi:tRNA(fMet)-specific endonuclease VapC